MVTSSNTHPCHPGPTPISGLSACLLSPTLIRLHPMFLSPNPYHPVSPFAGDSSYPMLLPWLVPVTHILSLPLTIQFSFSLKTPCLASLPVTDCYSISLCGTDSCLLTCLLSGVERTLLLPGSQTSFNLDDVQAGISYTVRVSARVGSREGGASVLTIRRGEHFWRLIGDGD